MTAARTPVAIYGAGHLGRQIHHHLRHHCADSAQVLGFIDDTQDAGREVIDGQLTLGPLDQALRNPALRPAAIQLVFAIGYANMTQRRAALDRVLGAGYTLFTVVHPRAVIEPGAVFVVRLPAAPASETSPQTAVAVRFAG